VKKVLETPSLPPAAAKPETSHEVWFKRGLVVLVAAAGVADQMLPEDSPWKHVVGVVFAVGAALGITSRGVQPKK
jgi:hypothetical protein